MAQITETGTIDLKAQKAAADAYKTVVEIDTNGIRLHPAEQSGSGIVDYTQIDTTGVKLYKGGTQIASFGDSTTVGKTGAAHTTMDSSGVKVYNADGSLMAQFGSNVVLGSTNGTYAELDSNGLRLKNKYSSYRTDVYAEFGETARIGIENFNHIDLDDASMSLSYGKGESEVKAFGVTTPSEMVEAEQEDGVIVGSWTTPSGSTQWLYYGANYSDTVFNSRGDGTASEPLYAAFYDGTAYRTFSFYLPQSDTASHPTNQIYLVGTVYMWYDADADSLRYGANQTNTALVTIVSRNAGATLTCGQINCGGLKVSGNVEAAGTVNNHAARKTLWSGTWSSGTLKVNGISDYKMLEISFASEGTHAQCFVTGSGTSAYVRGSNSYTDGSSIVDYIVGLNLNMNTDTLTWVACKKRPMTISSKAIGTIANLTVTSIIGVL